MRISLYIDLEQLRERHGINWLTRLESQAIAAELLGVDSLWLANRYATSGQINRSVLQGLWHLGSVTDRIGLGGIFAVTSETPIRSLANDLTLFRNTCPRLRIAVDARPVSVQQNSKARFAGEVLYEPIRQFTNALAVNRHQPTAGSPYAAAPQPGQIAVLAHESLAGFAGEYGHPLLVYPDTTLSPNAIIGTYQQVRDGRPGQVLMQSRLHFTDDVLRGRKSLATPWWEQETDPWRDPYASRAVLSGTSEQLTATLIVQQIAFGYDELLCELNQEKSHDELLQSIDQLGQHLLPRLQAKTRLPQPVGEPLDLLEPAQRLPKRQTRRSRAVVESGM